MNAVIDFTNLHEMTDGDKALEQELFEEFLRTCDGFMERLDGLAEGSGLEWRTTMHAFKGVALNLGAYQLGALCTSGQDAFEADTAHKRAMLQELHAAYAHVKQHIAALV